MNLSIISFSLVEFEFKLEYESCLVSPYPSQYDFFFTTKHLQFFEIVNINIKSTVDMIIVVMYFKNEYERSEVVESSFVTISKNVYIWICLICQCLFHRTFNIEENFFLIYWAACSTKAFTVDIWMVVVVGIRRER
jgi:hypothetical protein